jgi:hypothetical protein
VVVVDVFGKLHVESVVTGGTTDGEYHDGSRQYLA